MSGSFKSDVFARSLMYWVSGALQTHAGHQHEVADVPNWEVGESH